MTLGRADPQVVMRRVPDVEVLARVAGERLGDLERFADSIESWLART